MHHYYQAITNINGDSLIGYFARVINPVTQAIVTLASDNNGTPIQVTSGVPDMAKTDDFGNLSFYVEPGTYDVQIFAPNATTPMYRIPNVGMTSEKGEKGDKGDPGNDGAPGQPGGPILTGSVVATSISNDSAQQAAIRAKIGAGSAADTAVGLAAANNQPFAATAPNNLELGVRPVMRPNAAMTAALLSGTITICVVGDSIMEPAGISYANSVAENVQRLMQARFPWLTINLVNLSIPGRSMSDLANGSYTAPGSFVLAAPTGTNSSYWPGGSVNGKSWRDHVRDANADMIILALGENDGTDELPFSINYQTFYEYSQTWTKKPWFTLLASLLPEGSAVDRQGKQAIADFMKYKAIEQGFGLIDANEYYRLVRDGVRRDLIPAIEEINFAGVGDTTKWVSTGPTLSGTTLSGAGRVERQVLARDVDMVDNFTLGSADAVWLHNFRVRPGGVGGYSVQTAFADQGDTQGGAIRLFYRGSLVSVARFPAKANGSTVRIRVKAWGPLIRVWHDNVLLMTYTSAQGMYAGVFDVGTATGTGSHNQFRVAYSPEYQAAASYFSAAYLLNDVLHHPTAEGALQVYIPATKQFVDELVDLLRTPIALSTGFLTTDISAADAVAQIPGAALSFYTAVTQVVPVTVNIGYLNSAVASGSLTLRLDGQPVQSWFLKSTASETENRQLSFAVSANVTAGAHTLDLFWSKAGVTSNGGGNARQLSAVVRLV